MGQNMLHFMDLAPFSEKWGKQGGNVPNGGDWGDPSWDSFLRKTPRTAPFRAQNVAN